MIVRMASSLPHPPLAALSLPRGYWQHNKVNPEGMRRNEHEDMSTGNTDLTIRISIFTYVYTSSRSSKKLKTTILQDSCTSKNAKIPKNLEKTKKNNTTKNAWFFEDALTSDTAKKQTLWLLIFLYQRVFTKVLIEKGTVAFSRGRVLPDKSLIRKGWALLRKTLIDPEESHKGV